MNKGFLSRARSATKLLGQGVSHGARGGALTSRAAAVSATHSARALVRAQFGTAAREMGTGLRQLGVQLPVDAALMVGGRLVSFAQTLLGIEETGRPLRLDELMELQTIFGDSVDYERVVIKEGDSGVGELSGDRAFVHGNTIYMKRTPNHAWMQILVHEMVHVWQHQTHGTSYLSEALWAQRLGAAAYDWKGDVDRGVEWTELGPEQQAAMIEAAYVAGYFRTDRCEMGSCDYTGYMDRVRSAVLAGGGKRGASSASKGNMRAKDDE